MAKKVKNHNTGDALWIKKEYEFLKDAVDLNLSYKEAANIFSLEFSREIEAKVLSRRMSIWRNFKGSWEDFLSSNLKLNGSNYNFWYPPEVKVLLESVKKGLNRNETLSALEKETGFWRSYPSLDNKLQRLKADPKNKEYFINWKIMTGREKSDINSYPIHPDRKLKYIPKEFKSKGIKYPLICINGHEIMVEPLNWIHGCSECKTSFVGGLPIGPQPALTYLLKFPLWEPKPLSKLGYVELSGLSPIEAIHRTSKRRKYRVPLEIQAFTVSTKTEAGILEEDLKKLTYENRAFIEPQEFYGWTEFRTWETIEELREIGVFKTWIK